VSLHILLLGQGAATHSALAVFGYLVVLKIRCEALVMVPTSSGECFPQLRWYARWTRPHTTRKKMPVDGRVFNTVISGGRSRCVDLAENTTQTVRAQDRTVSSQRPTMRGLDTWPDLDSHAYPRGSLDWTHQRGNVTASRSGENTPW